MEIKIEKLDFLKREIIINRNGEINSSRFLSIYEGDYKSIKIFETNNRYYLLISVLGNNCTLISSIKKICTLKGKILEKLSYELKTLNNNLFRLLELEYSYSNYEYSSAKDQPLNELYKLLNQDKKILQRKIDVVLVELALI